jgi:hypothetical protein
MRRWNSSIWRRGRTRAGRDSCAMVDGCLRTEDVLRGKRFEGGEQTQDEDPKFGRKEDGWSEVICVISETVASSRFPLHVGGAHLTTHHPVARTAAYLLLHRLDQQFSLSFFIAKNISINISQRTKKASILQTEREDETKYNQERES